MPGTTDPSPMGLLHPLPWRVELPPPPPPPTEPLAPPLLLLHDHRQSIDTSVRQSLLESLSASERQRLAAYRLSGDRERFLLGRGGLRRLLGIWLGRAPRDVPLESGPHGKPHCPGGPDFNVSHSGELILLAVHPLQAVGVDVERLRPELDWLPIARRLFSVCETEQLEALPAAERPTAFLSAWCRLEARLKARGTGLAGLERLREQERRTGGGKPDATAPAAGSAAEHCSDEGCTPTGERLWDVAMPEGYRAAVALAPLAACRAAEPRP